MTTYIYDTLQKKLEKQQRNIKLSQKQSIDWFRQAAEQIKNVKGNKLMSSDQERLLPQTRVYKKHIGRMLMFFYDPKHADKLPYYDRFPLVIPIEIYNDGFLGMNLHYLPPMLRAKLLDALYTKYKGRHLDENKRLALNYQTLKASTKYRWFTPCVKRYLSSHVRSRYFLVRPEEWDIMLMLPTERFSGATKQNVWYESMGKIKGKL